MGTAANTSVADIEIRRHNRHLREQAIISTLQFDAAYGKPDEAPTEEAFLERVEKFRKYLAGES